MSVGVAKARLIQIGKESTRGDAVVATRRLLLNNAEYRIMEELEEFPDQMHGTLSRAVTVPVGIRNGTEFEITNNLDFEQVLLHLLSGLKGGVTPTTPGSGDARLWTFALGAADPAPTTYTVEFADRDFTDELGMESPYCFTTQFGITGGVEGIPELTASMVGRKAVTATPTSSIALPAPKYAGNLRWSVYIDDSWANLGAAQKTGQIYGFSWTLSELLYPQYYLDGRTADDFSNYQFRPKLVDLTIDVAVDPASGGLITDAKEPTDKRAGTKRFVRIEIVGDAFDAPDNGLNRLVRLDGSYTHAPDSMQNRGGDRDGTAITQIHLQNFYDAVQAEDLSVEVQNTLVSFP